MAKGLQFRVCGPRAREVLREVAGKRPFEGNAVEDAGEPRRVRSARAESRWRVGAGTCAGACACVPHATVMGRGVGGEHVRRWRGRVRRWQGRGQRQQWRRWQGLGGEGVGGGGECKGEGDCSVGEGSGGVGEGSGGVGEGSDSGEGGGGGDGGSGEGGGDGGGGEGGRLRRRLRTAAAADNWRLQTTGNGDGWQPRAAGGRIRQVAANGGRLWTVGGCERRRQ